MRGICTCLCWAAGDLVLSFSNVLTYLPTDELNFKTQVAWLCNKAIYIASAGLQGACWPVCVIALSDFFFFFSPPHPHPPSPQRGVISWIISDQNFIFFVLSTLLTSWCHRSDVSEGGGYYYLLSRHFHQWWGPMWSGVERRCTLNPLLQTLYPHVWLPPSKMQKLGSQQILRWFKFDGHAMVIGRSSNWTVCHLSQFIFWHQQVWHSWLILGFFFFPFEEILTMYSNL